MFRPEDQINTRYRNLNTTLEIAQDEYRRKRCCSSMSKGDVGQAMPGKMSAGFLLAHTRREPIVTILLVHKIVSNDGSYIHPSFIVYFEGITPADFPVIARRAYSRFPYTKLSDAWVFVILKTVSSQVRGQLWPADFASNGNIRGARQSQHPTVWIMRDEASNKNLLGTSYAYALIGCSQVSPIVAPNNMQ